MDEQSLASSSVGLPPKKAALGLTTEQYTFTPGEGSPGGASSIGSSLYLSSVTVITYPRARRYSSAGGISTPTQSSEHSGYGEVDDSHLRHTASHAPSAQHQHPLPPAIALPMIAFGFSNGLSMPNAFAGGLSVYPRIAGAASGPTCSCVGAGVPLRSGPPPYSLASAGTRRSAPH